MSDDQGFHEVQLSGKQLVFLFMSAVVVMVVVFLLGVNVGRGVRNAVGDTEVSAESETPSAKAPEDTIADAEPAKPAQSELSYHDMLLGATPAADKGAEKTPVSEAPLPIVEAPPPAQTPSPTPTRAPIASGSDWFLQTGAFSTQAVADGQVAKLKQLNVPAFVLPPDANEVVKSYRVRIGPYSDLTQAEQAKSRIARQGFQSLITR